MCNQEKKICWNHTVVYCGSFAQSFLFWGFVCLSLVNVRLRALNKSDKRSTTEFLPSAPHTPEHMCTHGHTVVLRASCMLHLFHRDSIVKVSVGGNKFP
jgi:hypothetical protein